MVKVTFPFSLCYLIFCSYLSQTLHPLNMRDNLACLNLSEGDYFGKTKEADWMDNQIYFSCQLVELLSPDSGRQTISALQRFVSLYDDVFSFTTRQPAVVTGFCHHVWEVEWMWTSNAFLFKHSRFFFQRD